MNYTPPGAQQPRTKTALTSFKRCPVTVLLVDDQKIISEALRRLLVTEEDITFHYCSDPTQALWMATEVAPTVILQDLVMPDIDGLLLLRFFRTNPATRDVPIIVLSVQDEANLKADAFAMGANDYLVKIPDKIELIARIRYHSQAYINLRERNAVATMVQIQAEQLQETLQELQKTQSQLIQTEKMSSLGQMVAGIAHEINNPINFIHGNLEHANHYVRDLLNLLQLYQQQYPDPTPIIQNEIEAIDLGFLAEDLPKILSSMQMGTDRIQKIVLSLRTFSRLDEAEIKPVNIHEGIDSTLLILNHRLKRGIEVIKQYGDLPPVECYPAPLNQVFMNIINNAIDALLEQEEQSKKQVLIQTEAIDSNQIKVRIRDNGPGISPEAQSKLFDPFFTTKPVGKGTGLGLAICYQIVEKHQGQIEVFSQLGQGTEFAIAIPVHQCQQSKEELAA